MTSSLQSLASCLEKNFGTFFNFGYFFSGLQATVRDFGRKTSYCQIRLKKLHSPTKHLEKNLKFSKIFFLNLFFRKLSDFFKVAIAIPLESHVGYQQLFTKFGRFWFCLAIFGKVWVNFSETASFGWFRPLALHCWAIRQNHQKYSNLKDFFETWKNFSFKVSDCLMFEWPALCNGIMLEKKFGDFFQFWLLFFRFASNCERFWSKD